ncbi:NUDIX domain-containing protein [Novosphingobium sp. G106]|uniref:NUDIX domain-containing protein n=1 Tax=Novosphingobium sp. G106 TaxID=2849500 RepID=UPI002810B76D|nr:NUDIX domain-containing protein [Novosphingobium sp. G106]
MARSAGILLYRFAEDSLEVLLVHPGGPFWRSKDRGAWQMPKGLVLPGEDDETAARREVAEELGCRIDEELISLGDIQQSAGKVVVAFAAQRNFDPAALVSNMIEIEWPPRTGRKLVVPEVDAARWLDLDAARGHMLPSQTQLLDRLEAALSNCG